MKDFLIMNFPNKFMKTLEQNFKAMKRKIHSNLQKNLNSNQCNAKFKTKIFMNLCKNRLTKVFNK